MIEKKEDLALLTELQNNIEVSFKDISILALAMTHSSFSGHGKALDNQRLELLGDSVLGLIVTEFLYHKFPDFQEGKITKIKNYLVSQTVLSRIARKIYLGTYLFMSVAEDASGGRDKDSSLADALEALIGAIYLDQGKSMAQQFILKLVKPETLKCSDNFISDYKSELQYLVQKQLKICPEYHIIDESGPNHSKVFTVELFINGVSYSRGEAKSKKLAEQQAAKDIFCKIKSGDIKLK